MHRRIVKYCTANGLDYHVRLSFFRETDVEGETINVYLSTVTVKLPVSSLLPAPGRSPKQGPIYFLEIDAALGNDKSKRLFIAERKKAGWSDHRIKTRLTLNGKLVKLWLRRPSKVAVAVVPDVIPGQFAYQDGRHRGSIAWMISGPDTTISARVVLTRHSLRSIRNWG